MSKNKKILVISVIAVVGAMAWKQYFLARPSAPHTTAYVDTAMPIASVTTGSNATATLSVSSSPTPAADTLNAQEKEQLQVLGEIFKSKNDNDPRMDTVLKNFSAAAKAALEKKYLDTKMELRNERGTITFLIGRELKDGRGSSADVDFLKNVLMEKPCLSLLDCSKPGGAVTGEEQHLEGIHETTAQYPQLMDLRYLKQSLEGGNLTPEIKASVIAALEVARNSPNPRVANEAQSILNSLQNHQ